jgi:hypothetical protein
VTLCSLVDCFQRYGGASCHGLHLLSCAQRMEALRSSEASVELYWILFAHRTVLLRMKVGRRAWTRDTVVDVPVLAVDSFALCSQDRTVTRPQM